MTSRLLAAVRVRRAFMERVGSLLLVAAVVATTACSGGDAGDKTTGPGSSVAGNYNLRTIDGDAPPVEVYHGPWFNGRRFYNQMVLVMRNGVITLDETDRWTMTFDAQLSLDGVVSQETVAMMGTYEIDNGNITLSTFDGQTTIAGTLRKGRISMSMDVEDNKQFKLYSFTR